MNRLWVRISLVIALIVIFITLLPVGARRVWLAPPEIPLPPPAAGPPGIPFETFVIMRDDISERVWLATWGVVVVGAGIGLAAGILLSRNLVRPLNELEKGARAVAGRNLAYRVPEGGSEETRSVARAFNEMAAGLEQSELLRRNMLADVTHELRHPVQVLRGNLQGILDGVFALSMEEVAFLSDQTLHLSQMVTDLHDLALAEARELPMHPQAVPLADVIRDALGAVEPLAAEKGTHVSFDSPEQAVWVEVDAGRMRQALHNLLANAIRFTPDQG
jgi:signal transduction histidine kinase